MKIDINLITFKAEKNVSIEVEMEDGVEIEVEEMKRVSELVEDLLSLKIKTIQVYRTSAFNK